MEKDIYSETIKCPKCHQSISKPNFDIHQAMCKGSRESFILNVNDPDFKARFSSEEEKEKKEQPPLNPSKKEEHLPLFQKPKEPMHEKKPPVIEPKPKEQIKRVPSSDEKFPCTYCGYMMTMAELDTHPAKCAMHTVQCPYCKSAQPQQLLNQHKLVCEKRPQENQPRPEQPSQPSRTSPNRSGRSPPLSPTNPRREQPRRTRSPINTQRIIQHEGNHVIERIRRQYEGGITTEQVRVDGRLQQPERVEQEFEDDDLIYIFGGGSRPRGIQSVGMPNIFFSTGSNANSFQRMIAQLMGQMQINRQDNPGLEEQEIKKLPIVKFNKATNGKQCPNCTICIKDYTDGDVLIKLPCGHLFNKECIYPWLKESSVCPNCRGPIKSSNRRQQS